MEDHVFLMFGAPKTRIVDNGVYFKNALFQGLARNYGVHLAYNAHPQCNPTERYLPKIGYAIRSPKHKVTGLSPNFVNFGREVLLKGDDDNFIPSESDSPVIDPARRRHHEDHKPYSGPILLAQHVSRHHQVCPPVSVLSAIQSFATADCGENELVSKPEAVGRFSADLVGPFTKWTVCRPLRKATAATVIQALYEEVINRFDTARW
ncbi:hypothetical protein ILUMI_09670 [Ignelater luminosus]|uniref:Integrase catalytic domain-containing protein n=1 Tax=Ignelater luminosus TaxID=2038154 RepID=A0A8K0G9F4_IGNLU|nr:hypothetical protein ILUMI_09670 [Ignelater luminosus]